MTGFATLIYTDCGPGQGLQGMSGLQFQASSVGPDGEAMELVRRNLLYEPPTQWVQDRKPVSSFPVSFAHICTDKILATATGIYLGREAAGGRQGNHLTHSVFTRDRQSFGHIRPAQLFGASFWVSAPAATKESDPVDEDWEPGPIDPINVREFVAAYEGGENLLATLHTELARRDRLRQVLFIATDPVQVIRWLVAVTLLLPQQRALWISFKVFTANPAYADHNVLAIHPDWNTSAISVTNDLGYLVVDLVKHVWTQQTTVAPESAFWSHAFLTDDPFDIADAVELAARISQPWARAAEIALAVVRRRAPSEATAENLLAWLLTGPEDMRTAYTATVVARFGDRLDQWSDEVVAKLDAVTCSGRSGGRHAGIRMELIRRCVAVVKRGAELEPGLAPLSPASEWGPDEQNAARQLVMAEINTAEWRYVWPLLNVAERFRLNITFPDVSNNVLDVYIKDWADHPDRQLSPNEERYQGALYELLRAELDNRIARSTDGGMAVGTAWKMLQIGPPNRMALIDLVLIGIQVREAKTPRKRRGLMDHYILHAQDAKQLERAFAALWRFAVPEMLDVVHMAHALTNTPRFANVRLGDAAYPWLVEQLMMTPTRQQLEVAQELVGQRIYEPRVTKALLDADREVCVAMNQIRQGLGSLQSISRQLSHLNATLLNARGEELHGVVLNHPYPQLVATVLVAVGSEMFVEAVLTSLGGSGMRREDWGPLAFSLPYLLASTTIAPVMDRLSADLHRTAVEFVRSARTDEIEHANRVIQSLGGEVWHPWEVFLERERKKDGRINRLLGRDQRRP